MTRPEALDTLWDLERAYRIKIGLAKHYGQKEKLKKLRKVHRALKQVLDEMEAW